MHVKSVEKETSQIIVFLTVYIVANFQKGMLRILAHT